MKNVSVIIPVARPQKAKRTIEAVKKQSYPKQRLEIITIKNKKLSPGEKRNLGAKKAKGEILIFLDDDCLPQKGWLKENLRALENKKVGAVGGMIKGKSRKYFARCVDFTNFTIAQTKKRQNMILWTASLGIRKEVFKKINGFNNVPGEDADLCMRLQRKGYLIAYQPKIKVIHEHGRETLGQFLFYQFNNGRFKGLTIENRYPDNFLFWFLKKISHPGIYWLFVLPFAVSATLMAILVNLRDNPEVVFYSPGIFLGKLACQLGIYVWMLKKP